MIAGKFDPKTYRAIPANVEWKNEPNKYVGRISWSSGAITVGTILFDRPAWKLRHDLTQESCTNVSKCDGKCDILLDAKLDSNVTCEVLGLK